MKIHELKCWPAFFDAIIRGDKTFEIRKNDRDFKVGDVLRLKNFDPNTSMYVGGEIEFHVTYVLSDPQFGIQDGYVAMGIESFAKADEESANVDRAARRAVR